jgi:GntR family transcriptional repressor for pyruvate dehydrogenase complex
LSSIDLSKVEPVRVFEQAVVQLRRLIVEGTLAQGDRLPTEQVLGARLGVGRSSIREALRVLEAEGLIEVRRGAGTFVASPSLWRGARGESARWLGQRKESLEQLLQVREHIEALTSSLAASAASPELIGELRQNLEAQAAMGPDLDETQSIDRMAKLDLEFHLAISRGSGNDIAHEIVSHVLPAFYEGNEAVLYVAGRLERLLAEHRDILAAIEASDAQLSESRMRQHISRVRFDILNLSKSVRSE